MRLIISNKQTWETLPSSSLFLLSMARKVRTNDFIPSITRTTRQGDWKNRKFPIKKINYQGWWWTSNASIQSNTGFHHRRFLANTTIKTVAVVRVIHTRPYISLYARTPAVISRSINVLSFRRSRKNGSPEAIQSSAEFEKMCSHLP